MAVAEDIVSDEPCPCTEPGPLDCYRAGLLAAARMASARAAAAKKRAVAPGLTWSERKHRVAGREQLRKLASDLRKRAGKK